MKSFLTYPDMGSVKIFSKDVSLFFFNEIGDIPTSVNVYNRRMKGFHKYEWLGHFTVKTKNSVFLSGYDCADEKLYTFDIGRWWVYLEGDRIIHIFKLDMDIHA